MEMTDACIFCGQVPCECAEAKPKKKAKPKRRKSPPPSGASEPSTEQHEEEPSHRVKPEHKQKTSARPERDEGKLIDAAKRNRSIEAENFWIAMRNLFNEGMVHEISVKRSLNAYPSIPEGIYGDR